MVEIQDIAITRQAHVVQLYEHDAELVGAVGPYLAAGALAGEAAIVIATEAHRRALDAELRACGIDPASVRADGRRFWLDAATTMASFMIDGKVDRAAFKEVVGGLVREACEAGRPVRAYGEMVALLWDEGNVLAAIELETLWNELVDELPLSLFCSYPATSVSGSEHAEALHAICGLHSSLLRPASAGLPADGRFAVDVAAARFPPQRESPGRARRLMLRSLRLWGCAEKLLDDAAIVLSELANNAVLHAGSAFSIAVRIQGSKLCIAVQDGSPLDTTAAGPGLIVLPGHGLGLIDALATRWGVDSASIGKVVWAELHIA